MPEVIAAFKLDHPRVPLSLETTSTHLIRDGLLNGLYDIALSTSDIRATGLDVTVIHQDRSVCVMPKKHPLAVKTSLHVRDLKGLPLLAHNPDDAAQQLLQKALAKHNVTPSSVIETSYSATICVMAAAGLGIGLVSPYAASTFADRIVSRPFSPILVHTQMARAPHAARSMLATQFEKRLRSHFTGRAI
jgi:DNA-binding transcriptional LysR family regulator